MKYLIAAVGIASLCTTAQALPSDSAARPKVGFIVEAVPRDATDSLSELDRYLGRALAQYADYWLSRRGYVYTVSIVNLPLDLPAIARLVADSHYTTVIYARPQGKMTTREVRKNDSHDTKSVGGYLELDIKSRSYIARSGAILSAHDKNVESKARQDWLWVGDEQLSSREDSVIADTPEPFEFVIQRAVAKLMEDFRAQSPQPERAERAVEATVYIDSSLVQRHGPEWLREIQEIARFASKSLTRQFGTSLSPSQFVTSFMSSDSMVYLRQSLEALKRNSRISDTLNILIAEQRSPLEYFTGRHPGDLGMTDLGGSRIAIDCMPAPHPAQSDWFPYMNSLILLHEIGHSFGAIHVFDRESIMAHRLTWMGTSSFDSLNVAVMKKTMSGEVDASNPPAYVGLMSKTLRDGRYPYADFPDFFWRFLSLAPTQLARDSLKNAIGYEPYILAAEAMEKLQIGDTVGAANRWKQALSIEPNQPVLLYYLSLSTKGADSIQAMKSAIELGLFLPFETGVVVPARVPH